MPDATIAGSLSLQTIETVFCTDFEPLRQATGKSIRGVLGVDFLSAFQVQIDFDRGALQLSEGKRGKAGIEHIVVPMSLDDRGRPHFTARVGKLENERVLIDTGATGNTIRAALFESLVKSGMITPDSNQIGLTVGGSFTQASGFVADMEAAGLHAKNFRAAQHDETSVGLNWLSRFKVILDFPNQEVLLAKGDLYDVPFSRATSGMAVVHMHGRKLIAKVRAGSPASQAGIWSGDELVAIDGELTETMDVFTVGQLLTSSVGRDVGLTIRRGIEPFSVRIQLADRLEARAPRVNYR